MSLLFCGNEIGANNFDFANRYHASLLNQVFISDQLNCYYIIRLKYTIKCPDVYSKEVLIKHHAWLIDYCLLAFINSCF